ncbi:carboxypeptidase regulatory-like domain-containing protein [uncultured Jatrophihabitans sp.]|uniref:carboxypeptidase regulatory-like domain-containing protein n=1 Tax=uncultured Jatrophihabitans sp. TaxID=1610747 RepID=UPI0035C9829A
MRALLSCPRPVSALRVLIAAGLATATVAVLAPSSTAAAPASSGWATWSAPAGSTHAFRGTMQLPARGFPAAEWTSDSRSPIQLPTGASTYLGAATPPGARYGSSRDNAYLNLRPYADNATSPSTTTFSFAGATPAAGWSFVLGDVDADQVRIEARDADGQVVPTSDVDRWERGAFNYAGDTDFPSWNAGTATLRGNAAAADTDGASDWFEPDRALSSLTFVFTRRAGFPVYQLWFASRANDVTGTVTGTTQCRAGSSTVRLLAPDGDELTSTQPDADGNYSFPGYTAEPGYTVTVEAPTTPTDGCTVDGAARRAVDLSAGDGVADFALRDVVPEPVGGAVTSGGAGVPDVTVTLTAPDGHETTTTTDETGRYLFDDNRPGSPYQIAVTPPDGYSAPTALPQFEIVAGRTVPDQDVTLLEQPSVSGAVAGPDGPLATVPVTLTDADGHETHTVTDTAGDYQFERVPAGTYTISATAPDGYAPAQDREGVVVDTTDRTGQDFTLTKVGSVAGTVTSDGRPVADVPVTVAGPGGDRDARTGTDGVFALGDLTAGTYTITVHPPAGYRIDGVSSRTESITAAGELRGGVDFTLTRLATTPPSTPPPTDTTPPTSGTGTPPPVGAGAGPGGTGSSPLAATGGPLAALLAGALGLLALGVGTLLASRRPRHR